MAVRPKSSISEQLNAAQIAVTNTLADAEIQGLVTQYGYTPEKLSEGKALYDAALSAVNAQIAAAGSQFQATGNLKAAEEIAFDAYQALAKVARAVFINNPARLAQLGLSGTMPRSTAKFLSAAYTIFDNANNVPEIKTGLASFGYSEEKLAAEKLKITAYDSANQVQELSKGAAQQATQDQVAALKAMNAWFAQYIKIARVALRDKKQLLEKIGVAARTAKTAAQKNASKKSAAPVPDEKST
jgi:hypothetical protein